MVFGCKIPGTGMIRDAGPNLGSSYPSDFFLEGLEEGNDEDDDHKDEGKGS